MTTAATMTAPESDADRTTLAHRLAQVEGMLDHYQREAAELRAQVEELQAELCRLDQDQARDDEAANEPW